jgi:hypothetical protein
MRSTLSLSIALSFTFCCGAVQAQSEPAARSNSAATLELATRLSRHGTARVQTRDGWLELTQPRLADRTALTYVAAGPVGSEASFVDPSQSLNFADISEIQVRGNFAGRGAITGGVIVGGLALLVTLPFTRPCRGGWADLGTPCGVSSGDVLATTIIAGAGGALVGAVIGAPLKRWKTVYRASTGG